MLFHRPSSGSSPNVYYINLKILFLSARISWSYRMKFLFIVIENVPQTTIRIRNVYFINLNILFLASRISWLLDLIIWNSYLLLFKLLLLFHRPPSGSLLNVYFINLSILFLIARISRLLDLIVLNSYLLKLFLLFHRPPSTSSQKRLPYQFKYLFLDC